MRAYTATLPRFIQEDLQHQMGLVDPLVVSGGIDRPNIDLRTEHYGSAADKYKRALSLVHEHVSPDGLIIVYCATTSTVEQLHAMACRENLPAGF
jgi:ATP-dependent DNA helicase RecQ